MVKITTAGRLLTELARESPATRDAVATAAGIAIDRADLAMKGEAHLTLSEQLRLAEAAVLCVPRHARLALRLRSQTLSARNGTSVTIAADVQSPADRWERLPQLRR